MLKNIETFILKNISDLLNLISSEFMFLCKMKKNDCKQPNWHFEVSQFITIFFFCISEYLCMFLLKYCEMFSLMLKFPKLFGVILVFVGYL